MDMVSRSTWGAIVVSQSPTIAINGAAKWYGPTTALQPTTLELNPGVWALLGPNGAGKSTLLNLCAGQLKPTLGEVLVCAEAPFTNPRVLSRIGFCPEADALYPELTPNEFVTAMAELSGVERQRAAAQAASTLQRLGLSDVVDRRCATLSRGMRQRVKLAQALVHEPDVLLLDEPWSGTDPHSRKLIFDEIAAHEQRGALIVVSTHLLHEAQTLTDRLVMIARGQLIAVGATERVREMLDEYPIKIRIKSDQARKIGASLLARKSVAGVRVLSDDALEVEARMPESAYDAIAHCVVTHGYTIDELTSPDTNLEALFNYLLDRQDPRHVRQTSPRVNR